MTEFILILLSTILVNNFVLVQFLGLCPFMGVSGKLETALGMSMATTFVLTLASILSYLTYQYILLPFELEFLRTISFILVIAVVVQFTEMVVHKTSPCCTGCWGFSAADYHQLRSAGRRAADYQPRRTDLSQRRDLWPGRGAGLFPGAGTVRRHA